MSFTQYIKDTKVELKHVAWPTQTQTIIYTILVIGISILISLYIGFFDFLFTRGLDEFLTVTGANQPALEVTPETSTTPTQKPADIDFDVLPSRGVDDGGMPFTPPAAAPAETQTK